jgi:hypothetical protein
VRIDGLGLIVFGPDQWQTNYKLQALIQSSPNSFQIGTGRSLVESTRTGIIITDEGRMIFVYGAQISYAGKNASARAYSEASNRELTDRDRNPATIQTFFDTYLETFNPRNVNKMFGPFDPWDNAASTLSLSGPRDPSNMILSN